MFLQQLHNSPVVVLLGPVQGGVSVLVPEINICSPLNQDPEFINTSKHFSTTETTSGEINRVERINEIILMTDHFQSIDSI